MKTLSKKIIKVILLFLSLSLINCQNEDDSLQNANQQENNQDANITSRTVSGADIPDIIAFVKSKSSPSLTFKFNETNYAPPGGGGGGGTINHEDDLTITQAITDKVVTVTQYSKTNYAFDMPTNDPNYVLNLIVVEHIAGDYMYFTKYVSSGEASWDGVDMATFEGVKYIYSDTGVYRTKTYHSGGVMGTEPCDCAGDGGGGQSCVDETWYICHWRGALHNDYYDCTCYNTSECTGFTEIAVTVCDMPNTSVQGSGVNDTTETCYCSNDWDITGGGNTGGQGSGGGSNPVNSCPGVTPCRDELQSFDENCECAYISNPITPVNSPSVVASMKNINACLGMSLTQDQKNWLLDLNNDTSTFALDSYLSTNNCSAEAMEEVRDFLEITSELPNAKYIRYIELTDLLEDNPWALIQDCAEQNGLNTSNYIDLYNHTIPQECSDRLNALGEEYVNQPITDGNVPLANIDYYGVEITIYPDFDNNGYPDSEAEIYDTFRNKFIDLASGEKENFQFSCNIPFNLSNTTDIHWEFEPLTINDGNLFVSDNPLTAIFLIEAGTSGFLTLTADEGTIIVSDFTNNNWTISTITSDENSTQPFSGNRQWGWHINQNNNLELFTRAVDVARVSDIIKKDPRGSEECQQNDYYNIAEATWDNMQQEIAQWVNQYGGQATVVPKTAVRVDKEKLKELLKSNETINQIPCN